MGEKYAECLKAHSYMDGKSDGCQKYTKGYKKDHCDICNCHRDFHRKVEPPLQHKVVTVYTTCHKIHDFKFKNSVDGCQEFIPADKAASDCAACGCHKSFHRNEITTDQLSNF